MNSSMNHRLIVAFALQTCLDVGVTLLADEPADTTLRAAEAHSLVSDSHNVYARSTSSNFLSNASSGTNAHPLLPSLKLAHDGFAKIRDDIQDYTCVLLKRERINGVLSETEKIIAKVRHPISGNSEAPTPHAVYLKFVEPTSLKGREILFISENDDSELLVRKGGRRLAFMTVSLHPTSRMAMAGNLYPITEFGIKRLSQRMIDLGTKELAYDECEVNIRSHLTLEHHDHKCACIEVKHPIKRDYFQYHIARIYIDETLQIPIQFESYDWPENDDDEPILKEEYIYTQIHLNVGLTDEDFDPENPQYKFR